MSLVRSVPAPNPLAGKLNVSTPHGGSNPSLFYKSLDERFTHTQVLGQTGSGKSNLIYGMIANDILQGNGVCLIDPQGKLYQEVLGFCLDLALVDGDYSIFERLHIIDPDIFESRWIKEHTPFKTFLTGFNPLAIEDKTPSRVDFFAKQLKSSFLNIRNQSNETMTPVLAKWLYCTFYTLIATGLPLTEAKYLLDPDPEHPRRAEILRDLRSWNPEAGEAVARDFELVMGMPKKDTLYQEMRSTNGLIGLMLRNEFLTKTFACKDSINIGDIMANGEILLVNTSPASGVLPTQDAAFFSSILLAQIANEARYRREREPDLDKANPFFVYLDEFPHYTDNDMISSLAMLRQYRVGYVLAYQYLSQLSDGKDESLHSALMNSTGNKIVFNVGTEDGKVMGNTMFCPYIDPTRVKLQLYSKQQFAKEPRVVTLTDTSHSSTESSSMAIGESVTDTTSNSSSTGGGKASTNGNTSGRSDNHSPPPFVDPDKYRTFDAWNEAYIRANNRGPSYSLNESTMKNDTVNSSWNNQTGSSRANTSSTTRTTGNATTNGTTYKQSLFEDKYFEYNISSIQYYPIEEQLHLASSLLAILPPGKAVFKNRDREPIGMEIELFPKRIYSIKKPALAKDYVNCLLAMSVKQPAMNCVCKDGSLFRGPNQEPEQVLTESIEALENFATEDPPDFDYDELI